MALPWCPPSVLLGPLHPLISSRLLCHCLLFESALKCPHWTSSKLHNDHNNLTATNTLQRFYLFFHFSHSVPWKLNNNADSWGDGRFVSSSITKSMMSSWLLAKSTEWKGCQETYFWHQSGYSSCCSIHMHTCCKLPIIITSSIPSAGLCRLQEWWGELEGWLQELSIAVVLSICSNGYCSLLFRAPKLDW